MGLTRLGGATLTLIAVLVGIGSVAPAAEWKASPDLVKTLGQRSGQHNYDEARVPDYALPELLVAWDDSKISEVADWQMKRRPEILELFKTHMFGRAPVGRPDELRFSVVEQGSAFDGGALRKQVKIHFTAEADGPQMDMLMYLPVRASGPVPCFLMLNFRGNHTVASDPKILVQTLSKRAGESDRAYRNRVQESRGSRATRFSIEAMLARGYGLATIYYEQIDPDKKDSWQKGVRGAFAAKLKKDSWGAIGAWAWALSRAVDYLETDARVDPKRIIVVGHSRLGKTSLWAGAQDERLAMVVSNNSGCGGAALSRRAYGETVKRINTSFPHWFCDNFKKFNDKEAELPLDQHMLIALMAPRPVYVASADQDLWADPKGEFLSCRQAGEVYQLLQQKGVGDERMPGLSQPRQSGRIGYHVRPGKHDVTEYDWQRYMDFADRHLGTRPAQQASYLSPLDTVATSDGRRLFCAAVTDKAILVLNASDGQRLARIALDDSPAALALSVDQKTLYVAAGGAKGLVYIIDTKTNAVKNTIPVGHTPSAVVCSPDGQTLYVCNQFNANVSVVSLTCRKVTASIPVLREPTGAVLSKQGKTLFVTNLLPKGAANGAYAAAQISVIDVKAGRAVKSIELPNGSMSLMDICLSPDGQHAYATHILGRYQLPTTQLERGWMNTNALSVIDVNKQSLVNTVLLDDVDRGAANPWSVVCTPDGRDLCISLAGTDELCVIDRAALHERLNKVAQGSKVSEVSSSAKDVPNDLAFIYDIKRRIKLKGYGSRGLTVIGRTAYVSQYFSDTLNLVDLDANRYQAVRTVALGPEPVQTPERMGELFFSSADLCFQTWQSCSSCHPGSRADALNWDLMNDGLGNPKNTKSMLLAHATPPAMVTGIRAHAQAAVRAGIRHIQFAVRPESDAQAIDAYLKSMSPVPSPYLQNGRLSTAAQRGKKVFQEGMCALCHSGPLHTDQTRYDVGTGMGREKGILFDTPSLVEVWRSAPYLHDGRAATIKALLTTFNKTDQHGSTSTLTEEQINDLAAYVLSL